MFLAKAITFVRERVGLTQQALAKKCKISSSLLSRIERKEGGLTVKTLEKVSRGLNLKVSELMIVAEGLNPKSTAIQKIGKDIILTALLLLKKDRVGKVAKKIAIRSKKKK